MLTPERAVLLAIDELWPGTLPTFASIRFRANGYLGSRMTDQEFQESIDALRDTGRAYLITEDQFPQVMERARKGRKSRSHIKEFMVPKGAKTEEIR